MENKYTNVKQVSHSFQLDKILLGVGNKQFYRVFTSTKYILNLRPLQYTFDYVLVLYIYRLPQGTISTDFFPLVFSSNMVR
jgi:hypothetical protein